MRLQIYIFLLGVLSLFASNPNFIRNPLLTEEMIEMMPPYLLPLDHPVKPILDMIFSRSRVVDNEQSIIDAGFSIITITNGMIVARHPLVPGLVFKMFRDSEPYGKYGMIGWECLTRRCIYAKEIKEFMNKNHLYCFKIPDKWLYLIPLNSGVTNQMNQPVVLLATDMEIESREVSRMKWKTEITPRHLDELYIILNAGYGSSSLVNNFPYTKHGTFAMIDLEKSRRKCDMKGIRKYLSSGMKNYWQSLIE